MSPNSRGLVHRIMGGLDLLIDFGTLGEYGLEELPADGPGCEATGRARVRPDHARSVAPTGWEAFAPARRGPLHHPRRPRATKKRRLSAAL